MTSSTTPQPRIAVVGSGLAGLTTAYLLRQRGFTVYLLEKSDKLGFHASSIDINDDDEELEKHSGAEWRRPRGRAIDVPMRSFQGGYYPHLISLYRHLAIPIISTHFTFSFSRSCSSPTNNNFTPHFIHSGASGHSIPSLPSRAFNSPLALVLAILKWIAYAGSYILLLALAALSYHSLLPCLFHSTFGNTIDQIADFLRHPIPYLPLYTPLGVVFRSFVHTVVVPLFSAVGTMPESDVYSMPARCVLDYVHLTVGTSHYSLGRGWSARDVAERLVQRVAEQGEGYVRLGTEITGVRYADVGGEAQGGGVIITSQCGSRGGSTDLHVDRIALATPASVAKSFISMLESTSPDAERERLQVMKKALGHVRYKETIVITHRDHSVLPASPTDVRDINLVQPRLGSHTPRWNRNGEQSDFKHLDTVKTDSSTADNSLQPTNTPHFHPSEGYTMATHVIQHPSGVVYQTTNPLMSIREESILGTARLERALPLPNPDRIIASLHPSSRGSVYLVGAYAYRGIPLLEGCVASAKRITETLAAEHHMRSGDEVNWALGKGGWIGRLWRWRR